jgi:hypothetical protein
VWFRKGEDNNLLIHGIGKRIVKHTVPLACGGEINEKSKPVKGEVLRTGHFLIKGMKGSGERKNSWGLEDCFIYSKQS